MLNMNRLESPVREWAKQLVPRSAYIQEHRVVMMRALNRTLKRGESVHHRNGNKLDNTLANLELWVGAHGTGTRAHELRCPHCNRTYV